MRNGKVYSLEAEIAGENRVLYVGSTFTGLRTRFSAHKSASRTTNSKLYSLLREVGIENVKIKLLSTLEVDPSDRKLLFQLENTFIQKYSPEGNTNMAVREPYRKKVPEAKRRINRLKSALSLLDPNEPGVEEKITAIELALYK